MEFLEAVGKRRSVRWFKTWEQVPREKIQRILEVVRLTTCPGNLQPWRAVVIERDKVDSGLRDQLLACDNWQGAHTQAPVWIYFYADRRALDRRRLLQGHLSLSMSELYPQPLGGTSSRLRAPSSIMKRCRQECLQSMSCCMVYPTR